MTLKVHADEPTGEDRLNRDRYAKGLANLAETCNTPLVVGLYGSWGIGKSSLMLNIEKHLDPNTTIPISFNAWQHQFDENPVVALAHTLVNKLGPKDQMWGKEWLAYIAAAFSCGFMAYLATFLKEFKIRDILKLGKIFDEKLFLVRDHRVKLREYFGKLVEKLRNREKDTKPKVLVFFIDDLDRCMPMEALKLLEALKLYLNQDGCVFFLGVARDALQKSIKHLYKDLEVREIDYLDKIVQLPFNIPIIGPDARANFIENLLPQELEECYVMLMACLGENPRQVKRFINTLIINYQLAQAMDIKPANPLIQALILLIQELAPELYNRIIVDPEMLLKLQKPGIEGDGYDQELLTEFSEQLGCLLTALHQLDLSNIGTIKDYLYLTKLASAEKRLEENDLGINLEEAITSHGIWLRSGGSEGKRADLVNANLKGANLRKADLRRAILYRSDLIIANLQGANLDRANLQEANLQGANLRGADLKEANLRGANLIDADLQQANLQKADLRGTNLRDAKVSLDDLEEVLMNIETILPNGRRGPIENWDNEKKIWRGDKEK